MTQQGFSADAESSASARPRRFQFGREKRLRSKAQITAVLSRGQRSGKGGLRLHTAPGDGGARLGVIAGRRAWPKAVDRNRFRRLVRETFRQLQHLLAQQDYIVRAPNPQKGRPDIAEIRRLFGASITSVA